MGLGRTLGAGGVGFFGGSSGLAATGFFGAFTGWAATGFLVRPLSAAFVEGLAFGVALFLGLDLGTGGLLRSAGRRRVRGRAGRSWTY